MADGREAALAALRDEVEQQGYTVTTSRTESGEWRTVVVPPAGAPLTARGMREPEISCEAASQYLAEQGALESATIHLRRRTGHPAP